MAPRGKGQPSPDRAGPDVTGEAPLATANIDARLVVPVRWLASPQSHDYPAAAAYLSLLAGKSRTRALVAALRSAPIKHYKAKDILRASGLPLLPVDNAHVAKDVARIRAGYALSPCLMIRGQVHKWHQAQIADGYHRVCASYYTDEDTDIPVKIVRL